MAKPTGPAARESRSGTLIPTKETRRAEQSLSAARCLVYAYLEFDPGIRAHGNDLDFKRFKPENAGLNEQEY